MPVGIYLHVPMGSASRGNHCEASITKKNRRSGCRCRKYCTESNHPIISTDLTRVLYRPLYPLLWSAEPPSTQCPHEMPRSHLHLLPLLPLLSYLFLHKGLSTCLRMSPLPILMGLTKFRPSESHRDFCSFPLSGFSHIHLSHSVQSCCPEENLI